MTDKHNNYIFENDKKLNMDNIYFDSYNKHDNMLSLYRLVEVTYHLDKYPGLEKIEISKDDNFINLRAAEDVDIYIGQSKNISLGVSIKIPSNCYAIMLSKHESFEKFGLIQTNGISIIDNYDVNKIWYFPCICIKGKKNSIKQNDIICKFKIYTKKYLENKFVIKEKEIL